MPERPQGRGAVQPEISGFQVALHNFQGPFDALLQLIAAKELDVTEVALAQVTDEFVAYTRSLGEMADLDEITEFLVVAATLLDLKALRLLPRDPANAEVAEILELKDLLFAKLLQYQAYAKVADLMHTWQRQAQRQYVRQAALPAEFAGLLPPVELGLDAENFALLAAGVFQRKPVPEVNVDHVHVQQVSVPRQASILLQLVQLAGRHQWSSFAQLSADCTSSMEVVGRFLALLELFKAQAIDIEQEEALGKLNVAWNGTEVDPAVITAAEWE
ncbi:MAG: segregation/condensation protein A [Corynebacterium sp.]|nr:segregation/condensation protein A [Corynebacterium sp.]